ncbi:MAG: histone deacetylase [Spirochaetales bacterium]|nr:MAG: histone deacetylase [Spirochaetales bacterium]
MVLYDFNALLNFPRFGIQIPALSSRKIRTLEALKNHPQLGPLQGRWLVDSYEDIFTLEDLTRVHGEEYARGFFDKRAAEQLKTVYELVNPDGSFNRWNPEDAEMPLEKMVPSILRMTAGTYRGARIALDKGFCHFLGGGTHHAHRDFGHGFCPVNDTALTLRRLQAEGALKRAWVIDVDAHKGDGTAALFHGDDSVFTLSAHMARGWPLDGSLPTSHPSWIPSDIDVPVDSGEEGLYLERLEKALHAMKSCSSAGLAVVLAGVDPWEGDALPSTALLKLSMEQLNERDWRIHTAFLEWALTRRLGIGAESRRPKAPGE